MGLNIPGYDKNKIASWLDSVRFWCKSGRLCWIYPLKVRTNCVQKIEANLLECLELGLQQKSSCFLVSVLEVQTAWHQSAQVLIELSTPKTSSRLPHLPCGMIFCLNDTFQELAGSQYLYSISQCLASENLRICFLGTTLEYYELWEMVALSVTEFYLEPEITCRPSSMWISLQTALAAFGSWNVMNPKPRGFFVMASRITICSQTLSSIWRTRLEIIASTMHERRAFWLLDLLALHGLGYWEKQMVVFKYWYEGWATCDSRKDLTRKDQKSWKFRLPLHLKSPDSTKFS